MLVNLIEEEWFVIRPAGMYDAIKECTQEWKKFLLRLAMPTNASQVNPGDEKAWIVKGTCPKMWV
jgi:hypothetical protein